MNCEDFIRRISEIDGRVAISSFGNPDPDAIASAFALGKLYDSYDLEFDFVFESEINRPENQLLVNYLEMDIDKLGNSGFDDYEHVSLVDCNPSRINGRGKDGLREELRRKLLSVQDHHKVDEGQAESLRDSGIYFDIRPELGSCSTMLAECLRISDLDIESKVATGLYYGLHSDTNGLLRSFTGYDLEQAANYVEGIDWEALTEIVGAVMTSETFEVIHRVTDEDLYEVRGTYKFANAGTLNSKNRSAVPQVADLLLREEGIEGVVVAGIDMDEAIIFGSVRYSGSRFTAEEIAAKIAEGVGSGGGHVEMGGFQVQPGVLVDTINRKSTQEALIDSIKERYFSVVGKRSEE